MFYYILNLDTKVFARVQTKVIELSHRKYRGTSPATASPPRIGFGGACIWFNFSNVGQKVQRSAHN